MRNDTSKTPIIKRVLFGLEVALAAAIVLWTYYAMGVSLYEWLCGIF